MPCKPWAGVVFLNNSGDPCLRYSNETPLRDLLVPLERFGSTRSTRYSFSAFSAQPFSPVFERSKIDFQELQDLKLSPGEVTFFHLVRYPKFPMSSQNLSKITNLFPFKGLRKLCVSLFCGHPNPSKSQLGNTKYISTYFLSNKKQPGFFSIFQGRFGCIQMGGQIPKRYRTFQMMGKRNLRFLETATAERLEKRGKKTFNASGVKSGRIFHSRILPSLKLTASLPLKMGL